MPFTEDHKQYNVTIRYHGELKSGQFRITVEYESAEGSSAAQHGIEHRQQLAALLERAGILRGDCCVRVIRAGIEELYRISRSDDAGPWQWVLQSQRVRESPSLADLETREERTREEPLDEPS